nr:gamma carbonic anhydrase family protein [Acidobacteriota bacterium]
MARTPDIRPYRGKRPQIAASAWIDPAATIIGDVIIDEDSSVWPGTIIRGDVH